MAEQKLQLQDWLDDLCVRFLIHLPDEDLSSVERICFQVEEAQWFYEDFIRPLDPNLPYMALRDFCLRMFQHCPLLSSFPLENHMRAFDNFIKYKTRIPVRGAIMLNEAMDSAVLVKGWKKSAAWSFPRGKINKDEDDLDCAIREVYEETGFDIRKAGLVPKGEVDPLESIIREQQIRLFVFRNVPMDTFFEPKTRKEISKIGWFKLSELPAYRKKGNNYQDDAAAVSNVNKFYMVAPFLGKLKKWIMEERKKDSSRPTAAGSHLAAQAPVEEPLTEDDLGAQTEPVAPPSNGTPAMDTLAETTRQLRRLLQERPATQGLQMSPSASSTGKGGALMELLQRGAAAPSQQGTQQGYPQNSQIPHTPLDHTYINAPEPHTPHHHHHPAHRLPDPSYEPPPNFPIAPHSIQPTSAAYPLQGPAAAQIAPQIYGRNPFMNQVQQRQNEPVLLHPQPLPPQVQQSVLTRDILPTPGLPDSTRQNGQQGQHVVPHAQHGMHHIPQGGQHFQHGGPNPFVPPTVNTYAPQQQARRLDQLTDHKMSLLNAFKSSPATAVESDPRGNTPQDHVSLQYNNPHQRPAASWANAPAQQAPNPAAQFLPHHMAPAAPRRTSPQMAQHPNSQSGPRSAQPADSHRNALLDMFKKPGPRSPLSREVRMQPSGAQQNPSYGGRDAPGSPAHKAPVAAETAVPARGSNGEPLRMKPEVNLPYRAREILKRPKADDGKPQDNADAQAQMQRLQQRFGQPGQNNQNAGRQGQPSPRDRAFPQQQENIRPPQQPNYAAAQAASLPYGHHSPSNSFSAPAPFQPQQTPTMLQRRKESNPEHQRNLLRLFSVEQQQQQQQQEPSPVLFKAAENDEKGKANDQPPAPVPGTPRSRVASFTSTAAGNNEPAVGGSSTATSRRGSQTPISPANRSFLLSFLESVTNPGR